MASRYPSFPLLLEAYRECLRDVFDMPALLETLRAIEQRQFRVHVVETRKPSPFASSLLFSYVANFVYDGDAPLAERRAQALTIDQEQLREILGEADLRELLDAAVIAEVEEAAQCLPENFRARSADGIHDLCLRLGDLSREELSRRVATPDLVAAGGPAGQGAAVAGTAYCRRAAPDRGRGCGAISRCPGDSAAAGAGGFASRTGSAPGARTGPTVCTHSRSVHGAGGSSAIWAGCAGGGERAAPVGD